MESCLVANIDRIIGRDDGEYETDEKEIMVYTIFQSYRWEKSYDESWVYRRHIPRSEHAFKSPFSSNSLYDSLYEYGC